MPTAQYPDPKKEAVTFVDGPIDELEGHFIENVTATLDGIVKTDAEYVSFELVDLFRSFIGIIIIQINFNNII